MKYPVNVTPHMICVDATKQQSFSFDFYGDVLCGVECYLFDGVTNSFLMKYYGFGRNDNDLIVEEENGTTLNAQRCGYNFGQIRTSNYILKNNKQYKYYLMISQKRINQFVFQGGVNGIISNQSLIVLANPLLHAPREYSNDFMTFGYYLAIDINDERKTIVNSIDNGDGTYTIVLDSPFSQSLEIGTQYRVYSNYIKTPEYTFKTRKNPTLEILDLDDSYLSKGGSAWFCKYNQENDVYIKSYNWTLTDLSKDTNLICSGSITQPNIQSEYTTKLITSNRQLTTKSNKKYIISNVDDVIEKDYDDTDKLCLKIHWCNLIQNSNLNTDKNNYVYVFGSKEHKFDTEDCIKLTYSYFSRYADDNEKDLICYLNGFSKNQDITMVVYDAFGMEIGRCSLSSSQSNGNTYDFSVPTIGSSTTAINGDFCTFEIADIPQSLQDKELKISIQDSTFSSFLEKRYYYTSANSKVNIKWQYKQTISILDDISYSDGYVLDTQSVYVNPSDITSNIIGKYFSLLDVDIDGAYREITDYNSNTGQITLKDGFYKYPSKSATFEIYDNKSHIITQTNDFYSMNTFYRNNYLAIDKKIKGEIEIRTETNNIFTISKVITFKSSEKLNGTSINILHYISDDYSIIDDAFSTENDKYIQNNFNINLGTLSLFWYFKTSYLGNAHYLSIYREEKDRTQSDLIYSNILTNSDMLKHYTDYLCANNTDYRYIILVQTKFTDKTQSKYKYYKYVSNWFNFDSGSWYITGLNKKGNKICNKEVYSTGDTWRLYAQINSGDITQNLNGTIYKSYSKYPKYGKFENDYISGSLTCYLGNIDCKNDKFEDDIYKVKAWRIFINEYQTYILKSDKGDIWHVSISDNPTTNYDEENNLITTISFSYTEIGNIHDIYIE